MNDTVRPITIGDRVTNGRPGPARVAGEVIAVHKGGSVTIRVPLTGEVATELTKNLRVVGEQVGGKG